MIDREESKAEVLRIDAALRTANRDAVLLVGGLAVNQYIPTRDSVDIDIVSDDETCRWIVRELYPPEEWEVSEQNFDGYRPDFVAKHRHQRARPNIRIGPKLSERQPYPYVAWQAIGKGAQPFRLRADTTSHVLVPTPSALAYSKVVAFCSRSIDNPPKLVADFEDVRYLVSHSGFSTEEFVTLVSEHDSYDYIRSRFRVRADALELELAPTAASQLSGLLTGGPDVRLTTPRDTVKVAVFPQLVGNVIQESVFEEISSASPEVWQYGSTILPADMQTADYATVVLASFGVREPRSAAHARAGRLQRSPGKRKLLVSEAALHNVGSSEAALNDDGDQIDTRAAIGECIDRAESLVGHAEIAIGFLPLSAELPALATDSYLIFDQGTAMIESFGLAVRTTESAIVRLFVDHFNRLWQASVQGDAAIDAMRASVAKGGD